MRESLRNSIVWIVVSVAAAACTEPTGNEDDDGASTSDTGDQQPLPNIDLLVTREYVEDSLWTTTESFAADHCAIEEGCVAATGERRLLRFSTYVPNVGTGDYVVGSPTLEPERFEWSACHEHWHLHGFADYRLLDDQGQIVADGHKAAFALLDLAPWQLDAGEAVYPLADGTQGISPGWVDVYLSHLDCQWVDITGLAAGDYQLEITINPIAGTDESTLDDNTLLLPIALSEQDSGPPGVPADWTCAVEGYGANSLCECGCGAFDPDCSNPTVDACEACNQPGSCAEAQTDCSTIFANDNSHCE